MLSQTKLPLVPDEPTLIYLDLLQVMAFLVAWSALIITITVKMVNAKRDIELSAAELEWRMGVVRERSDKFDADVGKLRADVGSSIAAAEESIDDFLTATSKADGLNERLRGENRLLRQKLSEAGITYEITSSD